jgi:hypothetical protein
MHKQRKPKLKFDSSAIDVDSVLGSSSIEGIDSVVAEMRDRSPLEPAAVYILPERTVTSPSYPTSGQSDQWSGYRRKTTEPVVNQTSGQDTKSLTLITNVLPSVNLTSAPSDHWSGSDESKPVVEQTTGQALPDISPDPVAKQTSVITDQWLGLTIEERPVPTLTSGPDLGKSAPETPSISTSAHSDQWSGLRTEVPRKLKYLPATTAQAAHDVWEQAVYDALWGMEWTEGNPPYKDVSAGYSKIRAATRFGEKTIIRNIRSLKEKLAIEEVSKFDRSTNRPNVYRVYSYREILNRRKSAGLQWVAKNKLGVTLTTGQDNHWSGLPPTTLTSGQSDQASASRPVVSRAPRPVVSQTSHIANKTEKENTTSTFLRELLQAQLPKFDNKIIDRLWMKCRATVPDVTEEEVSILFAEKLPAAFERGITNPNGFLLTAVGASCTRAAINAMRRSREAADPEPEPEIVKTREQQIAELEGMLADYPDHPTASPLWRRKLQELREGN